MLLTTRFWNNIQQVRSKIGKRKMYKDLGAWVPKVINRIANRSHIALVLRNTFLFVIPAFGVGISTCLVLCKVYMVRYRVGSKSFESLHINRIKYHKFVLKTQSLLRLSRIEPPWLTTKRRVQFILLMTIYLPKNTPGDFSTAGASSLLSKQLDNALKEHKRGSFSMYSEPN